MNLHALFGFITPCCCFPKRGITTALLVLPLLLRAQSYHGGLEATALNHQLVGMSVAVVCQNDFLDVYHYGLADIGRNIPVTDSTLYRVASVSKAVTATGLMTLYESGLFNLDDDVSPYLGFELRNPGFPDDPITIRMLLSHTSSLNDGSGYSYFLDATYGNPLPPTIQNLLLPGGTYFTANTWLGRRPGSYFNYSNVNYGIIGTLIERLSGVRFDEFMRDSVLLPLGITGSFNINHLGNIGNVAVLYRNAVPQADNFQGVMPEPTDLSQYVIGTNGFIFSPQGGLRITATALCRFLMMHAGSGITPYGSVLQPATILLMRQPQWTFTGTNGNNYYNLFNQWGLGFHLTTNTPGGDVVIPGLPMSGHPGEAYGLISDMYFETEKGFGLVFITNGYSGSSGYQYGAYSAFYKPEEEVFSLIDEYQYNTCLFLADEEPQSRLSGVVPVYDKVRHQLVFCNDIGQSTLSVYNLMGARVDSRAFSGMTVKLQPLPPGIYCWQVSAKQQAFSGKIVVW